MTIKASGPGPNPNPLSFSEIEAEFGSGGGQRRLGKYRRDDPAFQNEGPFSNADNGMLGKRPLDDGIPTGANATIKFSDFYSRKLNMIIKYYGGSAQNRTGTGGGNDNNQIATWKYHNEETNVIVVGNFKDRPAGSYDASGNTFDSSNWQGGKKVIIHVNKRIGSENSPNDQSYNRRKCALRTGRWPSGTDLRLDVGSSGQILGAGGDGRKGSSGNSRPDKAQGGTSALGVQFAVHIDNNGIIRCGYGGGGGGTGGNSDPSKSQQDYGRAGGGGGGGAGFPAGDGGGAGTGAFGPPSTGANGSAGNAASVFGLSLIHI